MSAAGPMLFCDGLLLVRTDGACTPAAPEDLPPEWSAARTVLDSFPVRPQGLLATSLSGAATEPPPGCEWVRMRALIAVESPWAAAACRALGLLNWRARHRFCGGCGQPLADHPVEVARQCPACGQVDYPALSPAVIVRVEKEGQILLARHVQRSQDFFTCVAGYVEVGETVEECVCREIREEVGLEVADVRYLGSQHWPYPNQLMLAFQATWKSGDIRIQPEELAEARWFDPAELPAIPPAGSVAYRLIRGLI